MTVLRRRWSVVMTLAASSAALLLARPLLGAAEPVPQIKKKVQYEAATPAKKVMKVQPAAEVTTAAPSGARFDVVPATDGPVVRDNETGRMWQRAPGSTLYSYAAAKAACDGKSLGGHSDWRLPRIEELKALVSGPVDAPLPAGHPFTVTGERWSSTEVSATAAQYMFTNNGNTFVGTRTTEKGAWCVRGGGNTAYPNSNPRFVVDGLNVRDAQTGRLWKRAATSQGAWNKVRGECLAHGPAWRLPTLAELQGLLDMNAPETPKLPVGHPFLNVWAPFDATPSWALDTSSPTVAATLRFRDGEVGSAAKTTGDRVSRCVAMDLNASWPLGPVGRFALKLGDAAVLDQETRLLWERAPVMVGAKYPDAAAACASKSIGGVGGWRLPSVDEISTLLDRHVTSGPKLPAGHPFVGVLADDYWTTTQQTQGTDMMTLKLDQGTVGHMSRMGGQLYGWCMRAEL